MTDVKSAWKDAGDRLTALGASLKTHYAQAHEVEGGQATKEKKELSDAAQRLTGAVQDAFEAMGAAAKDPSVKDDVRRVGQSLANALSATFAEVSEDLRRVADKAQPKEEAAAPTQAMPTEPSSRRDEQPPVEPWGTP
jgi:Flp pilus assembly pilin Flp